MTQARIALATADGVGDLDRDAAPLMAALARRGVDATPVVWSHAGIDWWGWELVVLRSTWDYPDRWAAFLRWVERVGRGGRLCNAAGVVAWNTHKRYLSTLAAAGVPVVPTTVHAPGRQVSLPTSGSFVVKPAVAAGTRGAARYSFEGRTAARDHIADLHRTGRDALVQPYIDRVDEHGETAVVFLGDRYSHAVRKGPMLAGPRRTVGGLFLEEDLRPRAPSTAERAVADAVLDALPFDRRRLLYARVDLLPGVDGTPLVLEVELAEPSLFLQYADGAADRLADAIVDRVRAVAGRAAM